MNYIFMALAGLFSGILGAMGLGGGGILIIYLTLFAGIEQVKAGGINLLFFIPSAIIAIIYYCRKKLIDWKSAIPAMCLGAGGGLLGAYFSTIIDGFIIGKIFGVLLLIMGISQILYKEKKDND